MWFHSFIALCRRIAPPGLSVGGRRCNDYRLPPWNERALICGPVVYSALYPPEPIKPAAWLMLTELGEFVVPLIREVWSTSFKRTSVPVFFPMFSYSQRPPTHIPAVMLAGAKHHRQFIHHQASSLSSCIEKRGKGQRGGRRVRARLAIWPAGPPALGTCIIYRRNISVG